MVQDVLDHIKKHYWGKYYMEALKIEINYVTYGTKKYQQTMEDLEKSQ